MSDLASLRGLDWINPPARFDFTPEGLGIVTGDRGDFWQSTFYGFRRDTGHALLAAAPAEFTATVAFSGDYEELYDQAGLMLRIDEGNWIKAGIEYSDGATNFSVVVTRSGASDWSVTRQPQVRGDQHLRLTRKAGAVLVHFLNGEAEWQHLRLADFPQGPAGIGPMACSPQRAGFRCRFSAFEVGPPLENPLH